MGDQRKFVDLLSMGGTARPNGDGPARAARWAWTGAALALLVSSAADADCSLVVRGTNDPPYFIEAPDGTLSGLDADMVREALGRIGCSARFVEMPFARALASLQDGSVAIVTGVIRTPERETFGWFSETWGAAPNRLYIRAGEQKKWPFNHLGELAGTAFRLGVQIGVVYGSEYAHLAANPAFRDRLVAVSDRASLWRMLAAGRVDGALADAYSAEWELRAAGLDRTIEPQGVIESRDPAYIAFSRKAVGPELVDRFNEAMQAMQRDGTAAAILQRYGVSE
jgi:polar amino acid transport system substrate-binding protein